MGQKWSSKPKEVNWKKELNQQYNIDMTDEEAEYFISNNVFMVVLSTPDDKNCSKYGDYHPQNRFQIFDTALQLRNFVKRRTWNNTECLSSQDIRWKYTGIPINKSF